MNFVSRVLAIMLSLSTFVCGLEGSFTTATYADTPQQNPDTGGAIGPAQYLTAIKGRVRTHTKNGVLDGALNTTLDQFFSSESTGNFLTDPHVRFDTFSGRWFILAITANFAEESLLLLAYSDGANAGVITSQTKWTYVKVSSKDERFNPDGAPTRFFDFPTLAVDQQAVYAGIVTFDQVDTTFANSAALVFQKSSLFFGPGPRITVFPNLFNRVTKVGAQVLQPADNFDAVGAQGFGYFIGNNVTEAKDDTLTIYKITGPGTTTPTISDPITVSVDPFSQPITVPVLGSTKPLNTVDTRLGSNAFIRNNRLWTSHHIGVDNTGDSSEPSCVSRVGARIYEIDVAQTPTLKQLFTLFTPSPQNDFNQISFMFPAVMNNSKGNLIIASSIAGTNQRFDSTYYLTNETNIAGGTVTSYTDTKSNFNPSEDSNQNYTLYRIGDFSNASLDPVNSTDFYVITEFAADTDTWGTQVARVVP